MRFSLYANVDEGAMKRRRAASWALHARMSRMRPMPFRCAQAAAMLALAALCGAALSAQRGTTYTFDADAAGKPPAGFTFAAFRQDHPGSWTIVRAAAKGSFNHLAEPTRTGWSLAVAPGAPIRDVLVSVRLRLAGGARAGGIVWRYQDAENFDAVLLDLTRREIAAYRVVAGNRITADVEDDLELDVDAWHTVKIVQDGSEIDVSLGGIHVLHDRERRDSRPREGLAGVVAGGSSDVWFDDLRIESRPNNARAPR
jgi:hypothetical protein